MVPTLQITDLKSVVRKDEIKNLDQHDFKSNRYLVSWDL